MLIPHLFVGLILGFVTAIWACSEGYSLLAMLGFYILGGSLGIAASATASLVQLLRPESAAEPLEPQEA